MADSYTNEGSYREDSASLFIAPPAGSYLTYGRAKLRCKTIKNVDRAKLVKRFIELRDFIREHKDETIRLCFDINEKLEA